MSPEEKLASLGIELPESPAPLGSYVPAVTSGRLVFISGMLPLKDGKLIKKGKLGDTLTVDDGAELARVSAINALSALKAHLGGLGRVKRCVRLCGYIASTTDFTQQPAVLNGASGLMAEVFGESGRHARAAVGVNVLPLDSPVEVEFVFEVEKA
jgi:enamine deaminase RidA (YjgF/YER057c/UK114 family)